MKKASLVTQHVVLGWDILRLSALTRLLVYSFTCLLVYSFTLPELQAQGVAPVKITIRGVVLDSETGETLPGASIFQQSRKANGVVTDLDGNFILTVDKPDDVLIVSYLGFETQEVKLKEGANTYRVRLKPGSGIAIDEVVVEAGIIQRNKLGFTGSYHSVSREELQAVGNINVLQSLKSLDPSFIITDDIMAGSNPNQLANISVRGGTTMSISAVLDDTSVNPNEPLFILDGFETTLQVVNDLDINRIESITILKDAGSTAIYGSRGANGVIVIETLKPKPGQVMVNYSGDLQLAAADLSVYNLMNATEKLQFELLSGYYGDQNDFNFNLDGRGDTNNGIERYNANRARVASGIDTYWLKAPIRTAATHAHSINISGGNKEFLYQVGASYKNIGGVMKGSSRETYGGNSRLTYRKDRISFSNNVIVSLTTGLDGPWGSFSDFANANPYYMMVNPDGTIPAYIDSYYNGSTLVEPKEAANPYYNASLYSKQESKNFNLTNNTSFDWYIRDNLRWQGSLNLNTSKLSTFNFIDPRHTRYTNVTDYTQLGQYTQNDGNSWNYNLNTSVSYNKSLQEAHNFTFIGRWAIRETHNDSHSSVATGFPEGAEGIPSFAATYQAYSRPGYSERVTRELNLLAALSYNYRFRYLLDVNYSNDGSSVFGSNHKYQGFWSVGVGWNINKEAFAAGWKNVSELKLRGTYGINGNQDVDNVTTSIYKYYSGSDIFGMASYLDRFANPDLQWQVAQKLSIGANLTVGKRLTLTLDWYNTNTNPMVINLEQKASTGISSYPVNMGYIDIKGVEGSISYYLIRDLDRRILWNVRLQGKKSNSVYGGFDNALENLNNQYKQQEGVSAEQNLNSLKRYRDGASPGDLWAVRSLGIDPATGKEIFLTIDGHPTFTYNADDRVVVGNMQPAIEGVVGTSVTYKQLTASFNIRYRFGAKDFNRALYNKVENITSSQLSYNQDKRALYDRWQQPGDISEFKAISLTTTTPISSRFIQRNDMFRGESGRISWDFSRDAWIKKLGCSDLKINISMTDVFTWSTMKQERGIDYPFQRGVSAGITAGF
jgi:TonB-linked SusC/RagA family outer membrane protein